MAGKKLGKGLSALISDSDFKKSLGDNPNQKVSPEKIKSSILQLPVKDILPNPDQPRQIFEEDKLKELAQSIKNVGLIEPIIVNQEKGKYYLIAGERRWRASQLAGYTSIPAVIKNDKKDKILEMMLIENIQREDLSPIEEANSYQIILTRKNLTQDQLASSLGKSRTYITNLLRILKLSPDIQEAINHKIISVGHGKIMVGLKKENQKLILDKIKKQNLSVREVEGLVKNINDTSQSQNPKTNKKDPHLRNLEDKLRDHFQTKVTVKQIKNKSGKIEIEYYDFDSLETILTKMKVK